MSAPDLPDITWRKSSHSGGNEGECVEVAAVWRKSSHSGASEGECVEIAAVAERVVAARDSKNPSGPVLHFGWEGWRAFTDDVKSGAYDQSNS